MVEVGDPRLKVGARVMWKEGDRPVIGRITGPGLDRQNQSQELWWNVRYTDEDGKVFRRGLFVSDMIAILQPKGGTPRRSLDFGSW